MGELILFLVIVSLIVWCFWPMISFWRAEKKGALNSSVDRK